MDCNNAPMSRPSTAWADDPLVAPYFRPSVRAFARRGLHVLLINAVVLLLTTYASGNLSLQALHRQWAYWFGISLTTWALIDMGRFVVSSDPESHWPRGVWGVAFPVLGCGLGFAIGMAIGDLINGIGIYSSYRQGQRSLQADLIKSLAIGAAFSGFYYLRGSSAGQQARLARVERDLTLARLHMLQAQLEPHMLFNTLANLRVLIGIDPARAQDMLDHMIAFLRSTLDGSRAAEHPLASEFKRLSDYLALMGMRMGARLQFSFDLPEGLRDIPVPALLLQPLVENSIRHGLEPQLGGGAIEVSAARVGQELRLTVRDTGAGLGPDRTDTAVGTAADTRLHFGLTQVRERLSTLYGPLASLTLENAPDGRGGAVACVRLPLPTGPTP